MLHFYTEQDNQVVMHDLTPSQGHRKGYYKSVSAVLDRIPKKSDLSYMFADNCLQSVAKGHATGPNEAKEYFYGIVEKDRAYTTAEWGTMGHLALEENDIFHEHFSGHVQARNELFEKLGISIVAQEVKVISHSLKLGGTIDVVFEWEHGLGLLDYKFKGKSMASKPERECPQLGLYGEMYPKQISRFINLIFDRNEPKYVVKEWSGDDFAEWMPVANLANQLYNAWAEVEWPKISQAQ